MVRRVAEPHRARSPIRTGATWASWRIGLQLDAIGPATLVCGVRSRVVRRHLTPIAITAATLVARDCRTHDTEIVADEKRITMLTAGHSIQELRMVGFHAPETLPESCALDRDFPGLIEALASIWASGHARILDHPPLAATSLSRGGAIDLRGRYKTSPTLA